MPEDPKDRVINLLLSTSDKMKSLYNNLPETTSEVAVWLDEADTIHQLAEQAYDETMTYLDTLKLDSKKRNRITMFARTFLGDMEKCKQVCESLRADIEDEV